MNVLSLFSGIGGLDLGFKMQFPEAQTICFVEIDNYCQKILAKRFPGIPIWEDVYDLQGCWFTEEGVEVDAIIGGFPCQPFSHAGKRKGTRDSRYLFDEIVRLAAECGKPKLFLENVLGLLSIKSFECLCGWPHRWGGVTNDREIFKQIWRLLFGSHRCRDDKIRRYLEDSAINLWWGNKFNEKEDSKMERGETMAYLRGSCRFIPNSNSSISKAKEKSSVGVHPNASHDSDKEGRMDKRDEEGRRKPKKRNAQIEQERTKPKLTSGSSCPACGRYMVVTTNGLVQLFGEILRPLSEMGYSLRWGVVGAYEAGAPHKRDRVWIIAEVVNPDV